MKSISLSRKLLTQVLTIYIILTVSITGIQITSEYYTTKSHIQDELKTLQATISSSLTRSIWELNTQQTISLAQGLLAMPIIEGVKIEDENRHSIIQLGNYIEHVEKKDNLNYSGSLFIHQNQKGLFGYQSPLIFEFGGRPVDVGFVSLFSSNKVIFARMGFPLILLIFKSIFITICLFTIIWFTFKKLLSSPLHELTEQVQNFDIDRLEESKLTINSVEKNELTILQNAYNNLINRLVGYGDALDKANKQLLEANNKLDEQNLLLEHEVAKKTAHLSRMMINIETQKKQLEENQSQLAMGIESQKQSEQALLAKQSELEIYLNELKHTQGKLLESEKMSTLGSLVAGVTHDVNTPIGISITANSFLAEQLNIINSSLSNKNLTQSQLKKFIDDANESVDLIDLNLKRATELISSFKQIAVDQASEAIRTIEIKEYVGEILHSLKPKFKNTQHKINFTCDKTIEMSCPAGAISQIFTNLVMNSLIHGFESKPNGEINISIADSDSQTVEIIYQDNGKGIDKQSLSNFFKPFVTTKANQGGSGLGTHIIYNLVKQTLKGQVQVESVPGQGLTYRMLIPKFTPF
ncbi:HAMP domain-containing histidine kinase [Catenovulum sp. 2E275]|uniref:sensor histidine kinase n=1 Tax=Catenovulum sp. 2E275 TaxID=2980497 RepID=UPI0021CFBC4B|nr:HAMP domain-containing sensor histidine kinase [Catenovulum sp. 2E275]MCU4677584.1 HAMP domain-containing histidine kinase [Catenovulum sp. 2E275]